MKKLVRRAKFLRKAATATAGSLTGGRNFQADYITQSIEQSLGRLNTDYLDLFLVHGPSPQDVADGDLMDALERLKDKGMIRHYGISCTRRAGVEDASMLLETPGV